AFADYSILMIGGYSDQASTVWPNDAEVYSYANNAWTYTSNGPTDWHAACTNEYGGTMAQGAPGFGAGKLGNGTVLIAYNSNSDDASGTCHGTANVGNAASIYNPVTNTWSAAPTAPCGGNSTMVVLPNGNA